MAASQAFQLMLLPIEVRLVILEQYFEDNPYNVEVTSPRPLSYNSLRPRYDCRTLECCPPLLRVCRQLTAEIESSCPSFCQLKLCYFGTYFGTQTDVNTVLATVPPRLRRRIGRIYAVANVPYIKNMDILPSLKTVKLHSLQDSIMQLQKAVIATMNHILSFNETDVEGVAVVIDSEDGVAAVRTSKLISEMIQELLRLLSRYRQGVLLTSADIDVRFPVWLCFRTHDGRTFGSSTSRTWSSKKRIFVDGQPVRLEDLRPLKARKTWWARHPRGPRRLLLNALTFEVGE